MSLEQTILDLEQVTTDLEAALNRDDHDQCVGLIADREQALAALAKACESADQQQLTACAAQLEAIVHQDEQVRSRFRGVLKNLGQDLGQLSNSRRQIDSAGPSCIDRKA